MKILLRLLGYLNHYRKEAAITYVSLLIINALVLVVPQLIQRVIDQGLSGGDRQYLITAALVVFAIALLRGFFGYWRMYLNEFLAQRVAYDLRNLLYDKYQTLPFAFHDRAHTGDLMARATSDTDQVVRFLGNGLLELVNISVLLAASLAIMLAANVRLTLLTLLPIPLLVLVTIRFGFSQRVMSKRAQDQMGRLSTTLQENLTGVRVVKAFARESYEV